MNIRLNDKGTRMGKGMKRVKNLLFFFFCRVSGIIGALMTEKTNFTYINKLINRTAEASQIKFNFLY